MRSRPWLVSNTCAGSGTQRSMSVKAIGPALRSGIESNPTTRCPANMQILNGVPTQSKKLSDTSQIPCPVNNRRLRGIANPHHRVEVLNPSTKPTLFIGMLFPPSTPNLVKGGGMRFSYCTREKDKTQHCSSILHIQQAHRPVCSRWKLHVGNTPCNDAASQRNGGRT